MKKALELDLLINQEYLTVRVCEEEKFQWNTWKGSLPSQQLRSAMLQACHIILEYNIEYILADFTRMAAPTLEDQLWIANHTGAILSNSKLKRVANLMAQDIFQQVAIETIYDKASLIPQPCESQDFISMEDALNWLFEGREVEL